MGFFFMDRSKLSNPSNFRKLAMGNWDGIGDPQVYGVHELDCSKALPYLEQLRKEYHIRVTVNHLVGRICALMLQRYPQLNGVIARGKIYLRRNVDIFFQVGMEGSETELTGLCIRNADQKGIVAFSQEVAQESEAVRKSADHPMRKSQKPFRYMPWRVARWSLKFINWLQYDLNINVAWLLGLPRDPLGSIMVTAIGGLGMEVVLVPLAHIGRTPAQIAVGKVSDKAVVINGKVEVRPMLNLCCTFDHRFMEGVLASKMTKFVREIFENIDQHRDLVEGKVSAENYPIPVAK